ncbi:MAG: serine/threonine protein kinase [Endozoicomonas sp.]|uniref:serine/threonine protein kinase n=1 Tax=Endozoicomonas sp. TaxID=1892382 RepID=UPI003D9BD4EA
MANVQKPPQDDSILYHLRLAVSSLGKATTLALGKAKAFCRSVAVVLIPTRLKKRLNLFKPSAPPLDQRSIVPMGQFKLSAILKEYSFPEMEAFKQAFKLRIKDIMDDIAAVEGEEAAGLYSTIKSYLLHRIDDCGSLDEILERVTAEVPTPYRQRLYVSMIQIGRTCGAELGLSEKSRRWLKSMVPNEAMEAIKESLFLLLKTELGQPIEGLAKGFRQYEPDERSLLGAVQLATDIPTLVSFLDSHFHGCEQYCYILKLRSMMEQSGYTQDAPDMKVSLLASANKLSEFKEKFFGLIEVLHKNEDGEGDDRSRLVQYQISVLALNLMNASDINEAFSLIKQDSPSKYTHGLLTAFSEICEETGDCLQLDPSIGQYLQDREKREDSSSMDLSWSHVSRDPEQVIDLKKGLVVDIENVIRGILEEFYAEATRGEPVDGEETEPPAMTGARLNRPFSSVSSSGYDTASQLSDDLEDYIVVPHSEINPEELPDIKKLEALKTSIGSCDSYEDMVRELLEHAPLKYARHLLGGLSETYENLKESTEERSGQEEGFYVPDFVPYDLPRERTEEKSRQNVFDHMQVSPSGPVVGQGSYGEVVPVTSRSGLARPVKALKTTLNADRSRELEILSLLTHPHIVSVEDYYRSVLAEQTSSGDIGFREGIQREFVGQNLHELVRGKDVNGVMTPSGPLPTSLSMKIAEGLLDALAYMHAQYPPVIHGDLKPDNVLVTADGEAKLSDFGSSALQDEAEIGWDDFSGNHGTAPPEFFDQSSGRTTKADMWAFGCVLYEMSTGEALIKNAPTLIQPDDPVGYIKAELESAMAHPALMRSPKLKNLLASLLEIDPEKRFSSVDAQGHPFWESDGIPIPDIR